MASKTQPWLSRMGQLPTKAVAALHRGDTERDQKGNGFLFYTTSFNLFGLLVYVAWLGVVATKATPENLSDIMSNTTNSFSTSNTAPGVGIPLYLAAGVAHVIFQCYVYRHVVPDTTLRGALGFGRGWFAGGINFIIQATILALFSYHQIGIAMGFSFLSFVFTFGVWVVHVRSRFFEIKDRGMFDWRIYFGSEAPHEVYFGVASLVMFWSCFSLGTANGDLWFLLAEDNISTILIPIWFGGVTFVIVLFTCAIVLPAFYSIVFFFIGTFNQTAFPKTSLASFFTAFANLLFFGWAVMEANNLSGHFATNGHKAQ